MTNLILFCLLDKDRVFANDKKITMKDNQSKIIKEFQKIKSKGFVVNSRPKNKDGGIGNTFEDHLKIIENNSKDPDFKGFEVKSKREFSQSFLSLFSKSPSYPKRGANKILRETFGEVREETDMGLKKLYASVYAHNWGLVYDKYHMKLDIDKINEVISLHIKDMNGKIIHTDTHWTFDAIKKAAYKKFSKLFVVTAAVEKREKIDYYHYTKADVYLDLDFEKLISEIEKGSIRLDLRIGVNKSIGGKNFGKTHDHGSGFRIKKEKIEVIFNERFTIE
jgi:hypothetical protein